MAECYKEQGNILLWSEENSLLHEGYVINYYSLYALKYIIIYILIHPFLYIDSYLSTCVCNQLQESK
jgi:hypothetical protein